MALHYLKQTRGFSNAGSRRLFRGFCYRLCRLRIPKQTRWNIRATNMCMRTCVCVHVCMHASVWVCIYYTYNYIYIDRDVYVCKYVNTRDYVCTDVDVDAYVFACVHLLHLNQRASGDHESLEVWVGAQSVSTEAPKSPKCQALKLRDRLRPQTRPVPRRSLLGYSFRALPLY